MMLYKIRRTFVRCPPESTIVVSLLPRSNRAIRLGVASGIELDVDRTSQADGDVVVRAVDDVVHRTAPVAVLIVPGAIALELDDAGFGEVGIALPAALREVVGHLNAGVPVVIDGATYYIDAVDSCQFEGHVGQVDVGAVESRFRHDVARASVVDQSTCE